MFANTTNQLKPGDVICKISTGDSPCDDRILANYVITTVSNELAYAIWGEDDCYVLAFKRDYADDGEIKITTDQIRPNILFMLSTSPYAKEVSDAVATRFNNAKTLESIQALLSTYTNDADTLNTVLHLLQK